MRDMSSFKQSMWTEVLVARIYSHSTLVLVLCHAAVGARIVLGANVVFSQSLCFGRVDEGAVVTYPIGLRTHWRSRNGAPIAGLDGAWA
jgi:hypothetical protein